MKADVVLVLKVDVSQVSAVIERMQQVLAEEFGVPALESDREHNWVTALDGDNKPMGYLHCGNCGVPREEALEPKRSARGLGPVIGSEWRFANVPEGSPQSFMRWRVVEKIAGEPTPRGLFTVFMDRTDSGADRKTWSGSVADHNRLFVEVTG